MSKTKKKPHEIAKGVPKGDAPFWANLKDFLLITKLKIVEIKHICVELT